MSFYEQPGRTTTTDRDGKQILTVTYVGTQEAPPPSDVQGTQRSKSVTHDVAGQVRTTYQFELDNPDDRPGVGATVEYVNSLRTVPIEAHPNYGGEGRGSFVTAEGKKIIRDAINTSGKKFSDIEDQIRESGSEVARARSLYGYLLDGVESYYVPSLVIRKSYAATSPPSGRVIGKIASPGVPVPGAPRGANFLLISITARGESGNYQITEEYEMSGEGGWDTFLYQSAP